MRKARDAPRGTASRTLGSVDLVEGGFVVTLRPRVRTLADWPVVLLKADCDCLRHGVCVYSPCDIILGARHLLSRTWVTHHLKVERYLMRARRHVTCATREMLSSYPKVSASITKVHCSCCELFAVQVLDKHVGLRVLPSIRFFHSHALFFCTQVDL